MEVDFRNSPSLLRQPNINRATGNVVVSEGGHCMIYQPRHPSSTDWSTQVWGYRLIYTISGVYEGAVVQGTHWVSRCKYASDPKISIERLLWVLPNKRTGTGHASKNQGVGPRHHWHRQSTLSLHFLSMEKQLEYVKSMGSWKERKKKSIWHEGTFALDMTGMVQDKAL